MRASDKLIRQNCPACHAEISLGSSSLNKKIHCPKCRNVVIIPAAISRREIPAIAAPVQEEASPSPEQQEFPPVPEPPQNRNPLAMQPMEQEDEPEVRASTKEPIIFCLCNGVIKRRIDSKQWGPSKNICCLCREEASSSL